MKTIYAKVSNQILKIDTRKRGNIIQGSQGLYDLDIDYDKEWENVKRKVVIFKKDERTIAIESTIELNTSVPWELLKTSGNISVGVVGYNETGDIIITTGAIGESNIVQVLSSISDVAVSALSPSPDVWYLIQNDISNLKSQTSDIQTKINTIEEGAEVNVQSDWDQADNSKDDFIKNKPVNLVQDANYIHTDNNFTDTEKRKLANIEDEAQVNKIESIESSDGISLNITDKSIILPNYALKSDITTVYRMKGSKLNLDQIKSIHTKQVGDVYNAEDTGMNYVWTGQRWDALGSSVDLSVYFTKNESDNRYVSRESGKGLSTNDYTSADKDKLVGIEAEANKTIVDDHLSSDSKNPVQNKVINTKFKGVDNDLSDIIQCLTTTTKGKTINLVGTTDTKIRDFKIFGDTSQARYSGKNLFNWQDPEHYLKGIIPNNDATAFITGSTNINYQNKIITLKIAASPSTTYTISSGLRFKQILVYESAEEPAVGKPFTLLSRQSNIQSVTVTTKPTTNWLFAKFYNTYLPEDYEFNELASSVQVEQSVTATDYEKFVGGLPSPNSEYPQEVKTVSGEQTIIVCGKNLLTINPQNIVKHGLSYNSVVGTELTINGTANNPTGRPADLHVFGSWNNRDKSGSIKLTGGETYTMSSSAVKQGFRFIVYGVDSDGIFKHVRNITDELSVTFTPPKDIWITDIFTSTENGVQFNNETFRFQLEKGDTATAYEHSQDKTYPISLGSLELCKIGDYQDKIYYDDGWKLERNVTKLLLDGSIDYYRVPGGVYYIEKYNDYATKDNIPVCERLIGANNTRSADSARYFPDGTVACSDGYHNNRIYIKSSKQNPSDIFNINPTKLYYGLKNPIISDITDIDLVAQLDAIKNSKAYKYTTNFTSTAEISVDTLLSANYLLSKIV